GIMYFGYPLAEKGLAAGLMVLGRGGWRSEWRRKRKENTIRCPEIQHGGAPLQRLGTANPDGGTCLGQCGIHRNAGGQRLVEGARQLQRGGIADLGLHGDHRWNLAPYQ